MFRRIMVAVIRSGFHFVEYPKVAWRQILQISWMIQFFTLSILVPEYINFSHLQNILDEIHIQETRMRAGVFTVSLVTYVTREGTDQQ